MAAKTPVPRRAAKAPALAATAAAPASAPASAPAAPEVPDRAALAAPSAPTAAPAAPVRPAPAAEKRCYVVGSVPIRHDGKFYGIGYDIELTSAEANRLGRLVALVPEVPKE